MTKTLDAPSYASGDLDNGSAGEPQARAGRGIGQGAMGPGAMAADAGQLAQFLPYQLSVASNAVSGLIAERYRKRFGLRITEWRVMAVLGDRSDAGQPSHIGMTQRALTQATLMDKVAVNRACKVLEERGLIMRAPHAMDGRSHLLVLTGEGRAVHAQILPLALATQEELFAGFSKAEQGQLRTMLEALRLRVEALSHQAGD